MLKNNSHTDPVIIRDTKFNSLIYVDDILISKTAKGLQECINTVNHFSDIWKLDLAKLI